MISMQHQRIGLLILLLVLLLVTRSHHFGSLDSLPDATLAVFFIGGIFLTGFSPVPCFFMAAGIADYIAIDIDGVSDWCTTPAYLFLIPAYLALWFGGRWFSRYLSQGMKSLLRLALILFGSVSIAFVVSNLGFYLFSGNFDQMPARDYITDVISYFIPYAATTFLYVGCALFIYWLLYTFIKSNEIKSTA